MLQEPIHDREFVKCLCNITQSSACDDSKRYGIPSIISSYDLGWSKMSVPRCSVEVSFEKVYKHIRSHFFPEKNEECKELPTMDMFFSNSGYSHFSALQDIRDNTSFSVIRFKNSVSFDSIVLEKRKDNRLNECVVLRTCEMIYDFPVISTYFNLFLKISCILTATEPGYVTFMIAAPYINIGNESKARNVFFTFNGDSFFKTCDKDMSVRVSEAALNSNISIKPSDKQDSLNLTELSKLENLISPIYFDFVQ